MTTGKGHTTFSGVTGRSEDDMRPFLEKTGTEDFLSLEIYSMIDSEWEKHAMRGAKVTKEGIQYKYQNHLVTNAKLAEVLKLRLQNLTYQVPQMRNITRKELVALNLKPAETWTETQQVPYSLMKEQKGLKLWVTRMHQRIFIKVKPSSIPGGMMWAIMEMHKDNAQILSWFKWGLRETYHTAEKEKGKPIIQMLAYILKWSMPRRNAPSSAIAVTPRPEAALKEYIGKVVRNKVGGARSLNRQFEEVKEVVSESISDSATLDNGLRDATVGSALAAATTARVAAEIEKGKTVVLQCEEGKVRVNAETSKSLKENEAGRGEGCAPAYVYPRKEVLELIARTGEPRREVQGSNLVVELRDAAQEGIYLDDQRQREAAASNSIVAAAVLRLDDEKSACVTASESKEAAHAAELNKLREELGAKETARALLEGQLFIKQQQHSGLKEAVKKLEDDQKKAAENAQARLDAQASAENRLLLNLGVLQVKFKVAEEAAQKASELQVAAKKKVSDLEAERVQLEEQQRTEREAAQKRFDDASSARASAENGLRQNIQGLQAKLIGADEAAGEAKRLQVAADKKVADLEAEKAQLEQQLKTKKEEAQKRFDDASSARDTTEAELRKEVVRITGELKLSEESRSLLTAKQVADQQRLTELQAKAEEDTRPAKEAYELQAKKVADWEEEIARLTTAEQRASDKVTELDQSLKEKDVEIVHWKRQALSNQYYESTKSPEPSYQWTAQKKRKLEESESRELSTEELQAIIDEVYQTMAQKDAEAEREVAEEKAKLLQHNLRVHQAIYNRIGEVYDTLSNRDCSVEACFQWIAMLVELFVISFGATPKKLSDLECVNILGVLPSEGREVFPRMMWEGRLKVDNPEVCNDASRGMLNLHVYHLMTAQEWAMKSEEPMQIRVEGLKGRPVPKSIREAIEGHPQATIDQNQVLAKFKEMKSFLKEADVQRRRHKREYGPKKLRHAFSLAGWFRHLKSDQRIETSLPDYSPLVGEAPPVWLMHYTAPCPAKFDSGMYDTNSPDPSEYKFVEFKHNMMEFMDPQVLSHELKLTKSRAWDWFHPSLQLQQWLDDRLRAKLDAGYYGRNVTEQFCQERQSCQVNDTNLQFRPMCDFTPSVYMPRRGGETVIPVPVSSDCFEWLSCLKEFYLSFHPGGPRAPALGDPRMLEAYVVARGLVTLCEFATRTGAIIRMFDVNIGVEDGGWMLYRNACYVGPGMVRWLQWVARSGWWVGLHASIGQRVDASPLLNTFEDRIWSSRERVGPCPTADHKIETDGTIAPFADHSDYTPVALLPEGEDLLALTPSKRKEWAALRVKQRDAGAWKAIREQRKQESREKEEARNVVQEADKNWATKGFNVAQFVLQTPA